MGRRVGEEARGILLVAARIEEEEEEEEEVETEPIEVLFVCALA